MVLRLFDGSSVINMQAVYPDSYMLVCDGSTGFSCGVYTRVPARCIAGSGDRCPGGQYANGNTQPTLCDGAPVYQNQVPYGPVLFRYFDGTGTQWHVSVSDVLMDCDIHHSTIGIPGCQGHQCYDDLESNVNLGRTGYPLTAPAYGQYTSRGGSHINVIAGGGQ